MQTPEYLEGASYYGTSETPPLLTAPPIPASDLHKADERSPLLQRSHSSRPRSKSQRRRMSSVGPHGDATVTDAVLMVCLPFFCILVLHANEFIVTEVICGHRYTIPWQSVCSSSVQFYHSKLTIVYLASSMAASCSRAQY